MYMPVYNDVSPSFLDCAYLLCVDFRDEKKIFFCTCVRVVNVYVYIGIKEDWFFCRHMCECDEYLGLGVFVCVPV